MNKAVAAIAAILVVCPPGPSAVAAKHRRTSPAEAPLPGMPPVLDANDIYSADHAGELSAVVRHFPSLVYVPNSGSDTVDVIDPGTFKVVAHFPVGHQPQHVTPSYDLKTLWVLNDLGDSLTRIDPATGHEGETIPVDDPYNMYYTPDGKYAIVVAERRHRLDFRDAQTMQLAHSLKVPCAGIDHMDFSANGQYLLASCEYSGKMVKVSVASQTVLGTLQLPRPKHAVTHEMKHGRHRRRMRKPSGAPQDVKLSPDGRVFYVADMNADGIYLVDGDRMKILNFMSTGKGTHGLYASRNSKYLYISNRGEGSVSVLDFATRALISKWTFPGGGSPDMGGVSADGKVLWLSGRYNAEVYAIDTADGHLLARIPVGDGPHGLCVYPQPGRYSLGHTGVFR